MPDPQPDQSLHLPSLVIKNFRGIDELTIPRLGRVTLLAGKNGVGKTTVLDAVRVWADRGLTNEFSEVLADRGDAFIRNSDSQKRMVVDRTTLFTDRPISPEITISVGPIDGSNALKIRQFYSKDKTSRPVPFPMDVSEYLHLEVRFGTSGPWREGLHFLLNPVPTAVPCNILGPNRPTDETVEEYWNEVALTSHEDRALEALNLIADVVVERVAALEPFAGTGVIQPRRVMAKVQDTDYQVPLRTLGDGAYRAYAVALALAKSSGGFLLIDEAENGIHHSIQPKFWNMVLQTAQRNNVQVIATTHSWDCVTGFAQAANELEDVEGVLVRIQRVPIGLRAITYDESRLENIAKHGIEVR
ncbi:MAG: AAA family ATPase [Chloroflexi bacterium]|nr:AAA family ATPase [Chloroflexota bacterium]